MFKNIIIGTLVVAGAASLAVVVYLKLNNEPSQQNNSSENQDGLASQSNEKFELAQDFLSESNGKKRSVTKAFDCYLEAAKLGHPRALNALEYLGDEMSAEEQIKLSQLYRSSNDHEKADAWFKKAKEVEEFKFKI